MLKVLGLKLVY